MRYLYSMLFYLALPFVFLRLLVRGRFARNYPWRWKERLGFCSLRLENCIWVHAVSLGETIAAVPLIRALQKKYPHAPLLVSNMTATGLQRLRAVFGDSVYSVCIPYDLPDAVSRFLDRINPRILVVMETELWPNLFAACKKRYIPLIVTNARLSEKSAQGYRRVLSLVREMFAAVSHFSAQAESDANRFIALGMPPERVSVTGSLKFDLELPVTLATDGAELRKTFGENRKIWIAASTHAGEEEILLDAHQQLRNTFPGLLLVLVPRHPERFDAVAALIKERNFSTVRRSTQQPVLPETNVYLGDTMGEMMLMYSASDIAVVGGSFIERGGHNMIEPAALGKPVVTGASLFNFADISRALLDAGAMIQANDAEQLAAEIARLFSDDNLRNEMGRKALAVVEKNRGALQRQLDVIEALAG